METTRPRGATLDEKAHVLRAVVSRTRVAAPRVADNDARVALRAAPPDVRDSAPAASAQAISAVAPQVTGVTAHRAAAVAVPQVAVAVVPQVVAVAALPAVIAEVASRIVAGPTVVAAPVVPDGRPTGARSDLVPANRKRVVRASRRIIRPTR